MVERRKPLPVGREMGARTSSGNIQDFFREHVAAPCVEVRVWSTVNSRQS